MAESPEEKEALAKLDEATREVAWQEEDKEADREISTALDPRYGVAAPWADRLAGAVPSLPVEEGRSRSRSRSTTKIPATSAASVTRSTATTPRRDVRPSGGPRTLA